MLNDSVPLTRYTQEYGCSEEVVTVVALLSVDSVLYTPADQRERALAAREKFTCSEGDHLTLLNIHRGYKSARGNKVQDPSSKFVHYFFMMLPSEMKCDPTDAPF